MALLRIGKKGKAEAAVQQNLTCGGKSSLAKFQTNWHSCNEEAEVRRRSSGKRLEITRCDVIDRTHLGNGAKKIHICNHF